MQFEMIVISVSVVLEIQHRAAMRTSNIVGVSIGNAIDRSRHYLPPHCAHLLAACPAAAILIAHTAPDAIEYTNPRTAWTLTAIAWTRTQTTSSYALARSSTCVGSGRHRFYNRLMRLGK
uniref:Uncharacterized protein n=1 Tax=Anopheles merus TaxID=30066 RepID=A0A182V942_ANOME